MHLAKYAIVYLISSTIEVEDVTVYLAVPQRLQKMLDKKEIQNKMTWKVSDMMMMTG